LGPAALSDGNPSTSSRLEGYQGKLEATVMSQERDDASFIDHAEQLKPLPPGLAD